MLLWATRRITLKVEKRKDKKKKQIHLCPGCHRERNVTVGAVPLFCDDWNCKNNSSDFDWIHHYRPHGLREMGKPTSMTFYVQSNDWATFPPRVFSSMLLRHGTMIKPVLSLYSFLRPFCFLDWVPCRHHQAQFGCPTYISSISR